MDDHVQHMATANSKVGVDLFKAVAAEQKDINLFLSPFSISAALAMTHLGARGNTSTQMSQVLHWPQQQDSIHQGFEDYLKLLKNSQRNYTLTTANRLFINQKYTILDDFLKKTDQYYGAKAVLADFGGDGAAEAEKINKWVEDATNNKIKNLMSGSIDPLTVMILVNAIYFKGNWKEKFDSRNTMKDRFKVKPGQTITVDMMSLKGKFKYGFDKHLKVDVLELPYRKKDLSMFFFLPFEDFGLAQLEDKLNHGALLNLCKKTHRAEVDIKMPRFMMESSFNLKEILQRLGVTDAFDDDKADLSGIDGSRELYVSEVLHKTFLEVNEEGSEAAAASAVRVRDRCLPEFEPFHADHPFLFAIYDNRADVMLFIGRLVRPTPAESEVPGKSVDRVSARRQRDPWSEPQHRHTKRH